MWPEIHSNALIELGIVMLGGIFGYAQLKFESKQTKKDLEDHIKETKANSDALWRKHDDLSGELRKEISDMSKSLARIEGKLENK